MTIGLIIASLFIALAVAFFGLRLLGGKPEDPAALPRQSLRTPRPRPSLETVIAPPPRHGQLDQVDTLPEAVPLSQLLADRQGPHVAPEALSRRAARLQERYRSDRKPEPMRALAKLLVDTVDAGLPDAQGFHDAARLFLATAPEAVLAEFAPEAEARFEALTPWLELDLSIAALRSVEERAPGPMTDFVAAAEDWREALHVTKIDELLTRIGHCAHEGRSAASDALLLARYIGKRPRLMPRAVSEMAMHPRDPVWTAAWLMLEDRALSTGSLSNIPAFRSRVMNGLRAEDPALVATAADAADTLLDHEAAGDLSTLWGAVQGALARIAPAPGPLRALADRLGLPDQPDEEA